MRMTAEKEYAHVRATHGCQDHDRDMVHELGRRLDFLWRCDQYTANADGHPDLQDFWRKAKKQEQDNIGHLKSLLCEHIEKDCF